MNKRELKAALSKIHASDDLVKEVLAMKKEQKTAKFSKKLFLAAVVAALLATTVLATPSAFNALRGGSVDTDGSLVVSPTGADEVGPWNIYDVYVDVEMNPNAPKSIETYYMLTLDSGYVPYEGAVYRNQSASYFSWTNGEKNFEDYVQFYQIAGGDYDPKEVYASVITEPGVTPETKLVELAGIQGYLVEDLALHGCREFLWSDGNYLFHLIVPDEYTDEDIAKVLEGIVEVEDILPYCISMTEEDREVVFG